MNKLSLLSIAVLLVGLMAVPGAAFGDVEIVDFDALMQTCVMFLPELDPATADNNNNGMLDATEFAVLSAVFADTGYSFHDTVHEAYKTNCAQLLIDLGAVAEMIVPELKYVLGAYATLGDGSYTRSPETFEGSWGYVADLIYQLAIAGSRWDEGAPDDADYDREESYAGACGDFDSDGVINIHEFHGQGGDRALYVAAVLDPLITTDGGDPLGICAPAGPNAQFTAAVTYGCVALDVDFTDLSDPGANPPIIDWSWDFDGDTIEDFNGQNPPTQTYTTAGAYTVSLTVSTATESDTETKIGYINAVAAEVDFDADTYAVCVDTAVNFTDLTNDCGAPITLYEWDFDDDGSVDDNAQNPSYAYDVPDFYDVRLTVTNVNGNTSVMKAAFITVIGPNANFGADTTSGTAPLTVTFTDLTTGCLSAITDWSWDFDFNVNPGEDYNGQTPPPFTYNSPGSYTVRLTVSTAAWSDTETKTGYIDAGGIIRVDKDSTDPSPDGSTWAKAFREIQDGIDALLGSWGEVWVAEGVYDEFRDNPDGAIIMQDDVDVYGGFDGTETDRDQRDWAAHVTTIDGSLARDDGAKALVPAYHVVVGANAVFDAFTVTGGNANGGGFPGNGCGGGMYNDSVAPRVRNCMFLSNAADIFGGGICNFFSSSMVDVSNCVLAENSADFGGGMGNLGADPISVTNCTFSANTAFSDGGGMADVSCSVMVTNCIVWGNMPNAIYDDMSPTVTYSDIQGGFPGTGNIDEAPLFAGAPGDLSIEPPSPCIDAGTGIGAPDDDILGVARPQWNGYDMGAYEFYSDTPAAAFEADRTLGYAPLDVQFTDLSYPGASPITDWLWDFGDAKATSTDQHPFHSFTVAGDFSVSLTVTNALGNDTETKVDYISVVEPAVRYVDMDNVSGTEDGLTWATAFTEIQDGIDAVELAGGGEVWVAEGTYGEDRTATSLAGAVVMLEYVDLYGGFSGLGELEETERGQRDWENNVTTIDGLTARGGSAAYHVVVGADNAALDGFTITGGDASGMSGDEQDGGGMYNDGVAPTVRNCTFTGNSAIDDGGAVCNVANTIRLTDCTFDGNTAGDRGGALHNLSFAEVTLVDCTFSGNQGEQGGALHSSSGALDVTDCSFTGNVAEIAGAIGATYACSLAISQCTFTQNRADAVTTFVGGAGAVGPMESTAMITDCSFVENSANSAGGIAYGGGAIGNFDGNMAVTNCIFDSNSTDGILGGGAVASLADAARAVTTLTNCTFYDNAAGSAVGGAVLTFGLFPDATATVTNCILWGDSPDEISGGGSFTATVSYCDVQGGYPGVGNIDADPDFRDAAGGDFRLILGSPCIDQANTSAAPDHDIDGALRPQGADADMGAYEYDSPPICDTITATTPNPTNGDTVSFSVGFSEDVSNFDADVDLVITETLTVAHTGTSISGGPQTYTVDVTGVTGDGVMRLAVNTASDVQDSVMNPLASSVTSSDVGIDHTQPTATITLLSTTPTGADAVDFEVAFDEPVAPTFEESDVSLSGTLSGSVGISGADPTYTVTITLDDPSADGTVGIDVAGAGAVTDPAGNPYAGGASALCEIYNWFGFTGHPEGARKYGGDAHTFTVVADCAASTLAYQWKWDDGLGKAVHDVGDDSPTYAIPDVTGLAGDYWCDVSYDGLIHSSNTATLEVEDHLVITQQPAGGDYIVGDSHTFTVTATGGYAPLTYAWKKEGVTVSTDAVYHIDPLGEAHSGSYIVEVTDDNVDQAVSDPPALLAVTPGLPAAGLAAFGLLACATALAGLVALRKDN